MQLFAYRNTEAGANRTMMQRLEHERARREAAEGAARQLMVVVAKKEAELQQRPKYPVFRSAFRIIEERAMKVFGLSKQNLHSNRRYRQVVLARQFVMYWAARRTTLSLPQIGKLLGGRDHTTVLHGKRAYVEKRALMGRKLKEIR